MGVDVTALMGAYAELVRLNSAFGQTKPVETLDDSASPSVGAYASI